MHRLQALAKLQWARIDPEYITINSHFGKHYAFTTIELGVLRTLWSFPFEAVIYVLKCISKCSNRKQVCLSVVRGFWLRRLLVMLFGELTTAPRFELPAANKHRFPTEDEQRQLALFPSCSSFAFSLLAVHPHVIHQYTEFSAGVFAQLNNDQVIRVQEVISINNHVFVRAFTTTRLSAAHPCTELGVVQLSSASCLFSVTEIAFRVYVWPLGSELFLLVWSDK
jgi:hypothetical protein